MAVSSNKVEIYENSTPSAKTRVPITAKERKQPMVTAIVLIDVERGKVNDVAENLVDLPGVAEVYSVSGRYDLVAIIRVKTNDEMANLITARMQAQEGITNTETMLAFRTYSQHDLEVMFSLGAEE
jgi:DNA-binding Lrp family transcriptional regulator